MLQKNIVERALNERLIAQQIIDALKAISNLLDAFQLDTALRMENRAYETHQIVADIHANRKRLHLLVPAKFNDL
ncbi:hypothetical protein B0H10DRAFT_2231865 [Mycena sp. CBHHK59/15]|nr:hypothetical protein B0H10DRAFT_2231865 [Mycena sp. CBHHK59/15]